MPAGEAELALVAPLKPGSQLGSYVIARIDAVQDGAVRVASHHADAVIELDIVLASSTPPLPPAKVGNYAIYFPPGAPSSPDGVPLAQALARVVSANLSVPTKFGSRSSSTVSIPTRGSRYLMACNRTSAPISANAM